MKTDRDLTPPAPRCPGLPNPVRLAEYCRRGSLTDAAVWVSQLRESVEVAEQMIGERLQIALNIAVHSDGYAADGEEEASGA